MRLLFLVSLLVLGGLLVTRHLERTSPQDLPWTPLEASQPIGLATRWKLARFADDPQACRAFLARSGAVASDVRRPTAAPGCSLAGAVRLERSGLSYAPAPVTLSCPLAAALVIWERQVVEPAAQVVLGSRISRIDHYGTYSCRRVYGRATGAWSQHATANAIDVAAFRTVDGRTVSVLADWSGGPASATAFLRSVHDGGCSLFGSTLGPDYNRAHANHFHLDMGRWHSCR